jgi:hypothetical protein
VSHPKYVPPSTLERLYTVPPERRAKLSHAGRPRKNGPVVTITAEDNEWMNAPMGEMAVPDTFEEFVIAFLEAFAKLRKENKAFREQVADKNTEIIHERGARARDLAEIQGLRADVVRLTNELNEALEAATQPSSNGLGSRLRELLTP